MKIPTPTLTQLARFLLPFCLLLSVFLYWRYNLCLISTQQAMIKAIEIPVSAQTNGTVGTIFVHNYSLVKRGDILFDLNTKSFELAVANAEEKLAYTKKANRAAEKAVTDIEKRLDSQQRAISALSKQLNYESQLIGQERTAAQQQLEEDKVAMEETRGQLQAAYQLLGKPGEVEAKTQLAEIDLAEAKAKLPFIHITAPTDGYIKNFPLQIGAPIKAQHPLFSIIEHNEWWVDAQFERDAIKRIRPYQLATIHLLQHPEIAITGMVIATDKDQEHVKIKILNPNPYYLQVGTNSMVTIDTQKHWKHS